MSRELKFRAWDEGNEVMHNDFEFIRSGTESNDWIIFKSDKQRLDPEKVLNNPFFQQQLKIMQFTGLRDKNGKEIYEGDVARVDLKYFDIKNKIGKVIFKDGMFGVQYGYCDDYVKSFGAWDSIEIIGNIYANPELLEAQPCQS